MKPDEFKNSDKVLKQVTQDVEVSEKDVELFLKCELPMEVKLIYRGVLLTCFSTIFNVIPMAHELFGLKSMMEVPKSRTAQSGSRKNFNKTFDFNNNDKLLPSLKKIEDE